jgi:uncharacterized membrane protein
MPNLHPILVHFTVALFFAAVAFDIIGHLTKNESLKSAGWWNLLFATVAAIASVVTGLSAANTLPHTDQIHEIMEIHETVGLIVLGILIGLFIWRGLNRGALPTKPAGIFLIAGIVGVGLLSVGAFYGGEMVYRHGMGVAPMMEHITAQHENGSHEHGAETPHHAAQVDSLYSCPMHPDVVSNVPSYCPKCGMALVKTNEDSPDTTSAKSMSDSSRDTGTIHIHDDGTEHEHHH